MRLTNALHSKRAENAFAGKMQDNKIEALPEKRLVDYLWYALSVLKKLKADQR